MWARVGDPVNQPTLTTLSYFAYQRHRIEFSSATLELACLINLAFPNLILIKSVVVLIQLGWTLITAAACMGLYINENTPIIAGTGGELDSYMQQGTSHLQENPRMTWMALLFLYFWGEYLCEVASVATAHSTPPTQGSR